MKKEYTRFLLIPILLFAALLLVNIDSAEAFDGTCDFSNMSNSAFTGDINFTLNLSAMTGTEANGITNVTFTIQGQDGVLFNISNTINNVTDNQTQFSVEYDTTGFPDQKYTVTAKCKNFSDADGAGVSATTTYTAVAFDNSVLSMDWEATTSGYNGSIDGFCPKDSTLYFGVTGSSDEMINADPILYFKSKGASEGFTKTSTVARGEASLNYTTTVNNTYNYLLALPADLYDVWLTYQDTDGTYINTSLLDIKIKCDGMAISPEAIEGITGETDNNQAVVVLLIIGVVLFVIYKMGGG